MSVVNIVRLSESFTMQDPNEDTQWNDVLRAKGIIPPREAEVAEEDIIGMVEQAVMKQAQGKTYDDMNLDELNDNEDDIDEEEERIFEAYRRQRMQEVREAQKKACYGDVLEISREDYVREVNQAGDGIWAVVHVYKNGVPLCKLINNFLCELAQKFPATKFLRSVANVCIPNYPEKNLPTIFVYRDGEMKKQFIGPEEIGGLKLTKDELEWMLSQAGAVETTLDECPRKQVRDVMASSIFHGATTNDSDDDDDGY